MSESDPSGVVAEPQADPVVADKGEGTTPEEVAKVLNLPADKPVAKVDDAEEGDDPDTAKPDKQEDEPDETVEEDKAEESEPEKPLSPDEATTDDKYSFQIEDANGATFKITADAKMEDILSEFEPKNNGQVLDILEKLREVKDLKKADDLKAEDDKIAENRRSEASKLLTGWQEEAKALQGNKRLPEGADGEKRISAVYKFMADENDKRIKDNKPTLNSFEDALDKLENKEARDKAAADAKADKDKARENGAKVGGSSAAASTGIPTYRAGSSRNSNEALRSLGLI